ncbi:MAG: cytochrome c oxidase assembly protein, partial [Candidatus Dormibacteria bacterium]
MLGLALVLGLYVLAWRRGLISSTDDVSPWLPGPRWRPVLFGAGLLIAYLALQSPIDRGGDEFLFSLHMVQHVLLMMVAPPLLLLGICGARDIPPGMPARWWRRGWRSVTRPWVATFLFTAVLLTWHIPSLYDATLTTELIHVVEHITFMAVGVAFWWPVVDPAQVA